MKQTFYFETNNYIKFQRQLNNTRYNNNNLCLFTNEREEKINGKHHVLAFEYKKWHTDSYSVVKSHSLLFQGIPAKNVVYVSERPYYTHIHTHEVFLLQNVLLNCRKYFINYVLREHETKKNVF